MVRDLIVNITVVTTFLFFYNAFFPQKVLGDERPHWKRSLIHGLVMGALGVILMYFSFRIGDNFFLDYRYIAVAASAMYGGLYASLLASGIIGLSRLLLFGPISESTIIAVINVSILGLTAGLVVRWVKSYWQRWAFIVGIMLALSAVGSIINLGQRAGDIYPYYAAILLVGSGFVAYLLYYLTRSIRQQEQLSGSEKRYRELSTLQESVFQSASEVSIVVTDAEGIVKIFNTGAEKLLGYSADEVIGRTTPVMFHLEAEINRRGEQLTRQLGIPLHGLDVFVEWAKRGKADEGEWTFVRKDGSHLTVNLIVTALRFDGEITGFIGIATDITARKRAEEELRQQNEELQAQQEELEVQQEDLMEALDKMERSESNLRKRNMLAQSLTNTLEQEQLLQTIVASFAGLFKADKGTLVILNEQRDYSAFGVSELLARQFIGHLDDFVLPRLHRSKLPFVLQRESRPGENGFHDESTIGYDFYVPILNAAGDVSALLTISRLGVPFSSTEEQEAVDLALQISLALDKLWLYRNTLEHQQLTRDMLDTIQENVQLLDKNGTVIQTNTGFNALMGLQNAEGMNLVDFLGAFGKLIDNGPGFAEYIARTLRRPEDGDEGFVYTLCGPPRKVVQVYAEPLFRSDQLYGILIVHRDITKEFELDKMKSDFVNTVSHELRTPLAGVLGFSELLLNRQLSEDKQRKYIGTIHKEANRLTALINDFLDLQRMESGRQSYAFVPLNLTETIRNVIDIMKVNTEVHKFKFIHPDEPVTVVADCDKMKQVILNLLSNAVKYSPAGGIITVRIAQKELGWQIDIEDEGLGIPEEALPHLFTKFYRVDSSDRRQIGGTGLGLSIVKEILTVHNGDISVSSVLGKGSKFTIHLHTH